LLTGENHFMSDEYSVIAMAQLYSIYKKSELRLMRRATASV